MSGAAPTAIRPELELAPGVWTDVSPDVVQAEQIRVSYGIRGSGPLARVAETGTALFSLRNDAGNAAGVQGTYSPNHPAARAGFGYGTGFRLAVTSDGTTYYKFRGRIVEIDPVAGQYGLQRTRCRAVDWMEDLAAFQVRRVAAQRDQRADDLLTTLIAAMPSTARPAAQILDRGAEPYPYAFYDLGGGTSGRAVAQKLMQSELGHLAVIGDTTQGGTLRFFNRHHRATADSAVTVPNTMHGLRVPSTIDRAFNDVRVTINPVRVDQAATTVLWALTTEPASSRPVIPAGQSRTFWGDYHDPDREAQLIGGTDQVAPVATTDYAANAAQAGTGADLDRGVHRVGVVLWRQRAIRRHEHGGRRRHAHEAPVSGEGHRGGGVAHVRGVERATVRRAQPAAEHALSGRPRGRPGGGHVSGGGLPRVGAAGDGAHDPRERLRHAADAGARPRAGRPDHRHGDRDGAGDGGRLHSGRGFDGGSGRSSAVHVAPGAGGGRRVLDSR